MTNEQLTMLVVPYRSDHSCFVINSSFVIRISSFREASVPVFYILGLLYEASWSCGARFIPAALIR